MLDLWWGCYTLLPKSYWNPPPASLDIYKCGCCISYEHSHLGSSWAQSSIDSWVWRNIIWLNFPFVIMLLFFLMNFSFWGQNYLGYCWAHSCIDIAWKNITWLNFLFIIMLLLLLFFLFFFDKFSVLQKKLPWILLSSKLCNGTSH